MAEKQYILDQWTSSSLYYSFPNGSLHHSIGEVLKRVETDLNNLADENEQLKKDVDYWKQVVSQLTNELNVFEHCKKYETECKDIHWSSD